MATYVNDLRLKEIATGDESGTWGTSTNTNLSLIGEAVSYATQESFSSDADVTTTVADGAADPARAFYFKVTSSGSLSATRVLTIAPNTMSRVQIIENATSGSQIITIKQGTGATVNIPNGETRMVYMDGAGSGAAVVDALADINIGGKLTVGVDDTGYDVKFFGATSGAYMLWDESADDLVLAGAAGLDIAGDIDVDGTANLDVVDIDGATQADGTITVGVDDTGYDVKFFGATSGAYMLWDESADDLKLVGAAGLTVAGDADIDGTTNLDAVDIDGAVQADGTITVGVNDTGYDVKFFGATSGAYMLWDDSADDLKLVGAAGLTVAGDADIDGTTNLDAVDIDGAVQLDSTLTVGVDDTGYDVKLFGATASKYMLWDESADSLIVKDIVDAVNFKVNGGQGTDGQVLTSTGSGVAWEDAAGGVTGLTGLVENNSIWLGNDPTSTTSTAEQNVAVGTTALDAITTGDKNTAIGYNALTANTTADFNVAIGRGAMTTNTTGAGNTAVGTASLDGNSTGNYNTAVGYNSLLTNSTAADNTAVGYNALSLNTTTANNTAVGRSALANNVAANNTAVGKSALAENTTGVSNTAVGQNALNANTTSSYNTAVGKGALAANTSGGANTVVGENSAVALTTGTGVTVIGRNSLAAATTSSNNIAVGQNAAVSLSSGEYNIAIGNNCMYAVVTGDKNIGIGNDTFTQLTSGAANIAMGRYTLDALTTGSNNIGIGAPSLSGVTTGDNNIGIGVGALTASTTASGNTAVGHNALTADTTGASNTAVGYLALDANTTASNNTAVGNNALGANTTGGYNVALGVEAGDKITTGQTNICIGYGADTSASSSDNQIVIGPINGGENNQFTFGKASNVVQNEFDTDANWTRTSDIRKKRDIKDDTLGLGFINDLRTVTHKWKPSNEFPKEWQEYSEENNMNLDAVMHGMIAQEVKGALDKAGVDTFTGWKERSDGSQTVSREMFVIPLIKAVQELSAEVEALKQQLNQEE